MAPHMASMIPPAPTGRRGTPTSQHMSTQVPRDSERFHGEESAFLPTLALEWNRQLPVCHPCLPKGRAHGIPISKPSHPRQANQGVWLCESFMCVCNPQVHPHPHSPQRNLPAHALHRGKVGWSWACITRFRPPCAFKHNLAQHGPWVSTRLATAKPGVPGALVSRRNGARELPDIH